MTYKRAKKLLMAAGFDRNAADFTLKGLKEFDVHENAKAFILALFGFVAKVESAAQKYGCRPDEVAVISIHCRRNGLTFCFARTEVDVTLSLSPAPMRRLTFCFAQTEVEP